MASVPYNQCNKVREEIQLWDWVILHLLKCSHTFCAYGGDIVGNDRSCRSLPPGLITDPYFVLVGVLLATKVINQPLNLRLRPVNFIKLHIDGHYLFVGLCVSNVDVIRDNYSRIRSQEPVGLHFQTDLGILYRSLVELNQASPSPWCYRSPNITKATWCLQTVALIFVYPDEKLGQCYSDRKKWWLVDKTTINVM